MIGKSQQLNALLGEERSPGGIPFLPVFRAMLAAIQFQPESEVMAEKIENVGLDRVLTAKLPPVHPSISQARPEQPFRIRRGLSQVPGKLDQRQNSLACVQMMF